MAELSGTWPDLPPEVPPPYRPGEPGQPSEPGQPPLVPHVPLVPVPGQPPRPFDESRLLEHRTLVLFGRLDHAAATRAAAQMMLLDAEGEGEIQLHLACEDADLLAALMLAETMELAVAPVAVIAKGVVGGAALGVLIAADRRVASPHAVFRMSEPRHALSGSASDVRTGADEFLRHVERLTAAIATATGLPTKAVAEDLQRGRLLDAEAAVEYGLIHAILTGPERAGPSTSR